MGHGIRFGRFSWDLSPSKGVWVGPGSPFLGEIQCSGWWGGPRSHLFSISGLCKARPAPSVKGKEAVSKVGRCIHGGSSWGGSSETLEEPQDAPQDRQEGPAAAEIPPGGSELIVSDQRLGNRDRWHSLGKSCQQGPLCGHVPREPPTARSSQRQTGPLQENLKVRQLERGNLEGQGLAPDSSKGPVLTGVQARPSGLERATGLSPRGVPPPATLRPRVLLVSPWLWDPHCWGLFMPGHLAFCRNPLALRDLRDVIKTCLGLVLWLPVG